MSATTPRHGLPFIWPTWITGLLSGDKQCEFAPWYRAHYRYEKRQDGTFDSAAWTAAHNALVKVRLAELLADGWTCTLEAQNDFRLKGKAALLSGKPDIVAVRGAEALVVDCKTGKPRNSDFFQVLIYMVALARTRPDLPTLRGEVCYSDHRIPIAADALTPEREAHIFAALRRVGGNERPRTTPSAQECAFCDVADCRDRVEKDESQTVSVGEF
jgi:CRISPR/Cas system-associated exonuclease Cas4 (RecB family)